jgi:hypothetical protein
VRTLKRTRDVVKEVDMTTAEHHVEGSVCTTRRQKVEGESGGEMEKQSSPPGLRRHDMLEECGNYGG